MPHLDSTPKGAKKLLIITSSGGGGLIQAANAKEQQARVDNPDLVIERIDVLKDWMGKSFGRFCSESWNGAQVKGNIAALKFLISSQAILDFIFWPYFFARALFLFFKTDADHVIDTQPIGTSAILKALRIYNHRRGKQVRLQKVLVDLPTKAATHFFRPIRRLTKKDRPHLQLTTISPLLEEGQTAEEFWQRNCRLSEKEVHYEDVYVRQAFCRYRNRKKEKKDFSLFLRFKGAQELKLIKRTLEKGSLKSKIKGDEIHFSIPPQDRVITILLGSQPASEATFNYVKQFVQMAKSTEFAKTMIHLFVFCAEHIPGQSTLFRKVADWVSSIKKYPESLSIVPFSFQSDDVIAPLFFRSDLTCTRSGGQTAMELMCVSSGEMWIHSETKKSPSHADLSLKRLLEGIPGWEAANALYLQKVRNAKIVTPELVTSLAKKHFREEKQAEQSSRALESSA